MINPNESVTVTFERLGEVQFARRTTVKVDVEPVPGEVVKTNNSAEYQVIFTLPVTARARLRERRRADRRPRRARRDRRRSSSAAIAWVRVRRLRDAQRMLIGGGRKDLVEFAVSLQGRIDDLHRAVDEIQAGLARVDRRVDTSVTNTAIVRYDAYEDTGGHQSASLALLDATRTGVVVTAIQGRDYARIYMKELDRGKPSVALSPEEQEAVDRAMGR